MLKGKRKFIVPKTKFENDEFILTVYQIEKYTGLIVEIENKQIKVKKLRKTKHLLLFDAKPSFTEEEYDIENEKYDTVEILSLWNLGYVEGSIKPIYHNPVPEKDMMTAWLKSKIRNVLASKKIYSSFCPSCKSSDLNSEDSGRIVCAKCNSKYTFYRGVNGESIWFNRLRRVF